MLQNKRFAYRILVGKTKGKSPLEDLDEDGWVILKSILDMMEWYGLD
jgi:hypothetical protein